MTLPVFKLLVFFGIVSAQSVLLLALFGMRYTSRFSRLAFLQRWGPLLVGAALLVGPLAAWTGVQTFASDQGQPDLVMSTAAPMPMMAADVKPDGAMSGAALSAKGTGSGGWQASQAASDDQIVLGKKLVDDQNCIACHRVQGKGDASAQDLSGVGSRHDGGWLYRYLGDPRSVIAGAQMPRYRFSEKELTAMTSYLLSLK